MLNPVTLHDFIRARIYYWNKHQEQEADLLWKAQSKFGVSEEEWDRLFKAEQDRILELMKQDEKREEREFEARNNP